jgi:membrane-associated phospholipid phosphatase
MWRWIVTELVAARGPVVDGRARLMVAIVTVLTAGFVLLALALRKSAGTALDLAVTTAIQRIDLPLFGELMAAVTALGYWPWDWLVLGVAAAGLWLAGFRRAVLFLLATPVPGLLTGSIKELIARPRPADDAVRVAWALLDFSFPSGHVVSFVSLYGFLFFLTYVLFRASAWRTALLLLCAALVVLVGPSRIYLGHHWASDVLGGYALGTAFLLVLIEGYRWTTTRPAATPVTSAKVPT